MRKSNSKKLRKVLQLADGQLEELLTRGDFVEVKANEQEVSQ
jgi:hypothetical protein